jgi:hypothetical protein
MYVSLTLLRLTITNNKQEDVLQLVDLSESIRRERRDRFREVERELERQERRDKDREEWERTERRRERDPPYDDEDGRWREGVGEEDLDGVWIMI